jgi:factor associated with neutral sphingomyelinase activation
MFKHASSSERRGRFDLLLLEDGEYFLEDFSTFMCVVPQVSVGNLRSLSVGKLKGRLKLCTKSILFEPDNVAEPVTRYRLKDMTECPVQYFRGSDTSGVDLGDDLFVISCSTAMKMREDGNHSAYSPVLGSTKHHRLFALVHTRVSQVATLLATLWETNQESRSRWEERSVLQPLLEKRIPTKFDNSLLVDFSERPLIKSCYVDRILPLVKTPGCLLVTTRHLYVQPAQVNNVGEPVFRCSLRDINRVYKRRYMLQQCGLEIFYDRNESSIFLAFSSKSERDKVERVLNNGGELNDDGPSEHQMLREKMRQWQKREIDNYTYLMFINTMADRSVNDLTQYPVFPWVIQDFDSAQLDLANPQTFRDLEKPIGALNKDRLAHFRQRYEDMPREKPGLPLPEGIPPPFMYGTHYSTPGYVLFYLVRVAPEYMLCLQNGSFDAPDRMFFSMKKTWDSVMNNPADLKELIPEFYDTSNINAGDFLKNFQDLKMGTRQNGKRLHDVELPRWAKSPEHFIEQMRVALESDFVSERLHLWIDLIFGWKQQGEEAEKADNLFYYMTYEGAIDLEKVTDPRERSSIEDQISEFGQTPKKLFETPHPSRNGALIELMLPNCISSTKAELEPPQTKLEEMGAQLHKNLFFHQSSAIAELTSTSSPPRSDAKDVGKSLCASSKYATPLLSDPAAIVDVSVKGELRKSNVSPGAEESRIDDAPPPFLESWKQWDHLNNLGTALRLSGNPVGVFARRSVHRSSITSVLVGSSSTNSLRTSVFTTSEDTTLKLHEYVKGNTWNQRRSIRLSSLSLSSCTNICVDKSPVIAVGSWDNNIYVYSVEMGLMIQQLNAHDDAVSCLANSGEYLCSGSWDSTVKIWKLTSKGLDDNPVFTGYDHDAEVNCVAIRDNIFVSGGNDGTLAVNDLNDGDGSPAFAFFEYESPLVDIRWYTEKRFVCACEKNINVHDESAGWSVLYSVNAPRPIMSLVTFKSFLLSGGSDGTLQVWESKGDAIVEAWSMEVSGAAITAIGVSDDGQTIVFGTKSGECLLYESKDTKTANGLSLVE